MCFFFFGLKGGDIGKKRSWDALPSSLDSLAQAWRALSGVDNVLGSYAGDLAPDHDGFLPDLAADMRAAFDDAEPMVKGRRVVWRTDRSERTTDSSVESLSCFQPSFVYVHYTCSETVEKKRAEKLLKAARTLVHIYNAQAMWESVNK